MAWEPFHKFGIALYDFAPGADDEYQVALTVDDRVEVQEESGGWYKGTVLVDPPRTGLFPAAYVQITGDATKVPPPPPKPAALKVEAVEAKSDGHQRG
jgi:hypothetical protein